MIKECTDCKKRGTMDCPQSIMCFSTENKLFYEEIEQKQHKRRLSANTKANIKATIAVVIVMLLFGYILLGVWVINEKRNTEFTELKKEVELLKEKVYEND